MPARQSDLGGSRFSLVDGGEGHRSWQDFDRQIAKRFQLEVIRQENITMPFNGSGEIDRINRLVAMYRSNLRRAVKDRGCDCNLLYVAPGEETIESGKPGGIPFPQRVHATLHAYQIADRDAIARRMESGESVSGPLLEISAMVEKVDEDYGVQVDHHWPHTSADDPDAIALP
jgi:hypothetical protein